MRIYLDTADEKEIKELMLWGSFAGITTNPAILKNAGLSAFGAIEKLSPLFKGDFFVQTWGDRADEMERHATEIADKLGRRAIIKVPSTKEGLETIYRLSNNGIWTAATALFTPGQALLAAEAGAGFVIPFFNRMEEAGSDAVKDMELICNVCHSRNKTKVLVASLKKAEQIFKLPQGIFAITIPPQLARELIASPQTEKALKRFREVAADE